MSEQLDLFNGKQRYRYWDVLDEMPDGWVIDKTAGSPLASSVFITNGKSPISGQQKRAILRVKPTASTTRDKPSTAHFKQSGKEGCEDSEEEPPFPAKSVNDLARLKFKEQILKEIIFDFMVCEIEGWDKTEYINELKELINGIKTD